MKKYLLLIFSVFSFMQSFANHIAGGELFYEYLGAGTAPNTSRYQITMRLFRDCNSTGQSLEGEQPQIGIYNSQTSDFVTKTILVRESVSAIMLNTAAIPCLVNAPEVCFQVGIYTAVVLLDDNAAGYTLAWVRCCRSDNIVNLSLSSGAGGTFITHIPGTSILPTGHNSSPQFLIKDTALVCKQKNFVLDFGATDQDGDSLTYSFCEAYNGGSPNAPQPIPGAGGLDLTPLSYSLPYSGDAPLGPNVVINPKTGKITGTAPGAGRYVINVCVTEWRNGKPINIHSKDFLLEVGNCDYAAADPLPQVGPTSEPQFEYEFISCKSFGVHFINKNNSSIIRSYYWDFGVDSSTRDTSSLAAPYYTYPDTGRYTIRLVVIGSNACIDSNSVVLGIYPGFKGDFGVSGSCYKNPYAFKDLSISTYGAINTWKWNFGDAATIADTSSLQNPVYKYPDAGARTVTLLVTNTNGCIDTIAKPVAVLNSPYLFLPFHDTLICTIDTLPLIAQVQGTGVFTWTPNYNITDTSVSNPLVYPKDTTTYVVSFFQDGCISYDSIKINTLDSIKVNAGADTTICGGDIILLQPVSYGLQYHWTPVSQIAGDPNIKYPQVSPVFNTLLRTDTTVTYFVTANLGKCQAMGQVKVKAVRYPRVYAGRDTFVCFNGSVQLSATVQASSYLWFPQNNLLNYNSLMPIATPRSSTTYTLTVADTLGCPKTAEDDVVVSVVPEVIAYAGHDTNIVAGQVLQLNAEGGVSYIWTPSTGMDNSLSGNPKIILGDDVTAITYTVKAFTKEGCSGTDQVKVVVYKTGPDIFVPSGFTPDGNGLNDILKPIGVALKRLDYFNVYNRWGQLLYTSTSFDKGWDGKFKGAEQSPGTYVYTAQAIDYLNRRILRKGTVVLVR